MTAHQEHSLRLPLKALIAHIQRRVMTVSTYNGVKTVKSPTDFWVYQEIIHETAPTVVVELGNLHGGSAMALSDMVRAVSPRGDERDVTVIGVDRDHSRLDPVARRRPDIVWVEGDASSPASALRVQSMLGPEDRVMVIEDSAHDRHTTLAALAYFSPLVTPGCYYVVEDGICWHGLDHGPRPGPFEACERFVRTHPEFVIDRERESFLLTWNPCGYLRKVR